MNSDMPHIIDSAIDWHVRQDTLTDAAWCDFVAWLEADPAHAAAYDAIAIGDRQLTAATFPAATPVPVAANDDSPRLRRWWPAVGGTAVAAALAIWLVPQTLLAPKADQVFATRNGERRDIVLTDGTQVAMSGGTTFRVSGADVRTVALEQGEATLHVVHDASRPFTLTAGNQVIRDLGTTFDVLHTRERVSVAVAEGSVLFQREGADQKLAAGDSVTVASADGRVVRGTMPVTLVGGWRDGALSFESASVGEVAARVHRMLGIDLTVSNGLSARPFTGMIHLTGAADRDVPHLAELIGASWRRNGDGWVLAERSISTR